MTKQSFVISASNNKPIFGDIRYNSKGENSPIILVLHGYKGWKDWGFIPYICGRLARKNALVINFNFSLCGVPIGSDSLENPDDFANDTISQELSDVQSIVTALQNHTIPAAEDFYKKWNGKIFLLGHSRGGGIALLAARTINTIEKTAIWNSTAFFGRFSERQKKLCKKAGFLEFHISSSNQTLRINYSYIEDIERGGDSLSPENAISEIKTPVLLIHGEQDFTIPIAEAERLLKAGRENVRLLRIQNTGHTFGIVHPFTETTPKLEKAFEETAKFFDLV